MERENLDTRLPVVASLAGEQPRQLRLRVPALDDVAAVGVVGGLIGGCVLLGLLAGWFAGLGLFFALLVAWGGFTLRAVAFGPSGDLGAERDKLET